MSDGEAPFDASALFSACVAGDASARRELVCRYHRAVRQAIGFCPPARHGRVGPSDIEDAVQQAFLTFLTHDARVLASWTGAASARTYLGRVAIRVATRHFQQILTRKGRYPLGLDGPDASGWVVPPDPAAEIADRLAENEAVAIARKAIQDRLSERGRVFYDYLFTRELSVAAIAHAEGTTANNVYQWKNRIVRVAESVLLEHGFGSKKKTPGA